MNLNVPEEVLHTVKEERNIIRAIKRRKANCIGNILHTNCIWKHIIEGKIERRIEVKEGRRRRCKQLDDVKEKKGWWTSEEEALDRTLGGNSTWKRLWTCRKTGYKMNACMNLLIVRF